METLNDIITKRFSKSLVCLLKVVDPERKYKVDAVLANAWDRLSLDDQRRLYLYLLYRKWRGEGFYGTPYEIVTNCHPYPTNRNGKAMIERLMKESKLVHAKYNGTNGIFTADEARVWEMTDVRPFEVLK